MKTKRVIFGGIIVSILLGIGVCLLIYFTQFQPTNRVMVNDLLKTIEEHGEDSSQVAELANQYGFTFYQMDGSYVVTQDVAKDLHSLQFVLILFIAVFTILIIGLLSYVYCYNQRNLIQPLKKAQYFAKSVASGNLDYPLTMEKDNVFGAFTESFDLMRDELLSAQEREHQANVSKKDLVASLSHDIKTPLASIKVIAEVLNVTTENPKQKDKILSITEKATQIEELVNNLLHSTLEELQELPVQVSDHLSGELVTLLERADYKNKVMKKPLVDAMVIYDEVRMQQILDNLISNSYKYAGTNIYVSTRLAAPYFELLIQDDGPGIQEEERFLVTGKYYRGENSKEIPGSGIGLYVANYLMEKMQGELKIIDSDTGFGVLLRLRLA